MLALPRFPGHPRVGVEMVEVELRSVPYSPGSFEARTAWRSPFPLAATYCQLPQRWDEVAETERLTVIEPHLWGSPRRSIDPRSQRKFSRPRGSSGSGWPDRSWSREVTIVPTASSAPLSLVEGTRMSLSWVIDADRK